MHLFEFIDQAWFPKLFRRLITDLLQHELMAFDVYTPIVPKIKEVMQRLNCRQIIDLCSGSTGPLLRIQKILSEQENYPVSVILTDKYPNLIAFQRLCRLSKYPMNFVPTPVDATSVPGDYHGIRTLFTAFHHFRPEQAKQILQDAVNKNAPIGIFEFTERTMGKCLHMILHGPFIPLRMVHSLRPFRWERFFWTYIVPVLPIVYTWDALVTRLRSYSIHELNQLVSEVKSNNYTWEIGQVKSDENGLNITYLLGFSNRKNNKLRLIK